jgi:hypothetical protein
VDLAAPKDTFERFLVHPKVVAGRGLDVLVPGKLLDEHDVGPLVQQTGAKRVPEQVWRQFLGDAASFPEPSEYLGHVIAAQAPGLGAGGGKQGRACIVAACQVTVDPRLADRREEDRSRLVALADHLGLPGFRINTVTAEGQGFGNPQACRQQHFDEGSQAQSGMGVSRDDADQLRHLLLRQELHLL